MKGSIVKENKNQEIPNYSWSDTDDSTDGEDVSGNISSSDAETFLHNDDSSHSTYAVCSCCNDNFENGETIHECRICERTYHPLCHIPIIGPRDERIIRQCTLCEDMDTISRDLGKNENAKDLSVGTVRRKIAERILMELYCSDDNSDDFRALPHVNIFPSYHQNVVNPIALNDIRDFLHNHGLSYEFNHFINDVKSVFVSNMSYCDIGDPSFDNARRLLTNLKSLYSKWVAPPTRKHWNIR